MKNINLIIVLISILFSKVVIAQEAIVPSNQVIEPNKDSKVNVGNSNFDFLEPSAEKDIFFPKYINHGLIYNYRFKIDDEAAARAIVAPTIAPITIPNLVVKTILYKDAKNWAVWVNGKKITSFNQYENKEFSVFSVSKNFVQFVMFYPDLKFFEKSLSAKLSPYQKKPEENFDIPIEVGSLDWDYANEAETILANKQEGIILVTLEPSQSFSSNDMKIKEAFYKLEDPVPLQPEPLSAQPPASTTTDKVIQGAKEVIDTVK